MVTHAHDSSRRARRPARPGPLLSSGLLLGLVACGGGGGGAPTPVDTTGGGTGPAPLSLQGLATEAADRDGLRPLRLEGEGFADPAQVVLLADAPGGGEAAFPARVLGGGTIVEAEGVRAPGRGGRVERRVLVRNGDGRDTDAVLVPFVRTYPRLDGRVPDAPSPDAAAPGRAFLRLTPPDYADGDHALAGEGRPSARAVSNGVLAQDADRFHAGGASDMLWQWGQFLDHDLDLTLAAVPQEPAPIAVPEGDPSFDPAGTGTAVIPFSRSAYLVGLSPRMQVNAITAFVDASQVYGSDETRAARLRANDGTGRLRTSEGDLLPIDDQAPPGSGFFLAGDVRVNEQVALTALHVLFVREHNRVVDALRARHPGLTEDDLYLEGRRAVAATLQAITYREFLPILLGRDALPPYRGHVPTADPGIANEFATSAFRFGHSLLNRTLRRVDASGATIAEGDLALRDAFFAPARLTEGGGIEPLLRGLAAQASQELDARIVDDVRNFLFGPPGSGGLDLASLNVQRGRDHGLPSYNATRAALGLPRRASFAEVTRDPETRARLAATYASVDDVDLWPGALAEDHLPGASVGEVVHRVLVDQFTRTRDADPFWYERVLSREEREAVERSRLADVIRRNTAIGDELGDVWRVRDGGPRPPPPGEPPPPR